MRLVLVTRCCYEALSVFLRRLQWCLGFVTAWFLRGKHLASPWLLRRSDSFGTSGPSSTLVGIPGIVVAGIAAVENADFGSVSVSLLRVLVGTAFLGAVSDTMLLGHWYLVQPGMPRRLINELVDAVIYIWPLEVVVLLLPTGMISVINGTIDDGWNGVLGWFWLASAIVTGVLAFVTRAALKERSYSAVMAATGLMYLAILTAFCTDIVARALLAI